MSFRTWARRLVLEGLEDRRLLAFDLAANYPAGTHLQAVITADFNNDGRIDLATANYSSSDVSVLLGNADGTFQPAVSYPTGASPQSLAVGDLDGDGKVDDLASMAGHDVSVLLGNDDGTFQPATTVGVGSQPTSMAVGDFNGDGLFDLGVTSYSYYSYYGPSYHYANVLLGTGGGRFSGPNATLLDINYFVFGWAAVATDLNGDAYDDFVTLDPEGYVTLLLGDSSGFLQEAGAIHTGTGPYYSAVAAGDLDGDGDNDLAATNYYFNSVGVLLGDGLGGFSGPVNYTIGESPNSIVLGDFTHDGILDVATTSLSTNQVSVLFGNGDGGFSMPAVSVTSSNPMGIAAGDFNGDGWLDASTAHAYNGGVSVLINDQVWTDPPPPPLPFVHIDDIWVTEGSTGSTSATFTVRLSAAHNQDVTVHFETADGSATAGSDYTAASGDLTIAAGSTTQTFVVAVLGDGLAESTENFVVNLSAPVNATLGDAQGIGSILDDDTPPTINIGDAYLYEGHSGTTVMAFTVDLSEVRSQTVQVNYATANNTAKTSDNDFVAQSGTLVFAPGETSKTIEITVKGDTRKERDERLFVNLSGAVGGNIDDGQAVGTILNDDGDGGNGKGNQKLSSAAAYDLALAEWLAVTPKTRRR